MNCNVRPVEHFHEVAAGGEQGDAAVPGGDHLSGNSVRPLVISRLDEIYAERLRVLSDRLVLPG